MFRCKSSIAQAFRCAKNNTSKNQNDFLKQTIFKTKCAPKKLVESGVSKVTGHYGTTLYTYVEIEEEKSPEQEFPFTDVAH